MTTDTPPPPPEGWAIVPADDPRLDCLPCIPLMRLANGKWEASIYQKGRCVSQDSRANYTYALPIQAEAGPGQAASAKPLAKLLLGDSWVTIFTPEKARGCDIKEVIWLRDYTSEEYAIVDSSCRRGTPMRLECTDQQSQDVPDQPPASADPRDEEIARLKECLFQMQEAAKGLAKAVPGRELSSHTDHFADVSKMVPPASADPKGPPGAAKPPALGKQEGGSHYKNAPIQPVEYIHANGLTFLEGCVVKRITRHRRKNGAEDIRKAIHELELILALDYPEETTRHPSCPD